MDPILSQFSALGDTGRVTRQPAPGTTRYGPFLRGALTSRGWWCPKEQRYLRRLARIQDEFEVAYTRIVVVSIDPPEVQAAFRAGLGARFTFLSDAERGWLPRLGLLEATDTVHRPYRPAGFTLSPDLTIHRVYNGYWFWGSPDDGGAAPGHARDHARGA